MVRGGKRERPDLPDRTYRRDHGDSVLFRLALKVQGKTMSIDDPRAEPRGLVPYLSWGAIFVGAIAAGGLSFVLHSFATAIGLSISSSAPTWRDASFALVFLTGLYLVLAAVAAYALGGYLAGRMCSRLAAATPDENEFRDGVHGLVVWGLATLLTAFLALATAQALTRVSAPSAGTSGPAASVGSENIIAYDAARRLELRAGRGWPYPPYGIESSWRITRR
jgi:hypothetical protein